MTADRTPPESPPAGPPEQGAAPGKVSRLAGARSYARSTRKLMRPFFVVLICVGLGAGAVFLVTPAAVDARAERLLTLQQAQLAVAQTRAAAAQLTAGTGAADPFVEVTLRNAVLQSGAPTAVQHEAEDAGHAYDTLVAAAGTTGDLRRYGLATAHALDALGSDVDLETADARAALDALRARSAGITIVTVAVGLLLVIGTAWRTRRLLLRRLDDMAETATRITQGSPERLGTDQDDHLSRIASVFNATVEQQQNLVGRLESEVRRSDLGRQIADALDMADDEHTVHETVGRALVRIDGAGPAELLVRDGDSDVLVGTDNGHQRLCQVEKVGSCVALRRGAAQTFPDAEAVNACPYLRPRAGSAPSASCFPVTFLGQSLGVLHVVGVGERRGGDHGLISELASLTGGRLGTLHAFAREQRRAVTDALTGLPNRRGFEEAIREVLGVGGVLAMGDLDHFKLVNDLYGHETGDKALQTFAHVLKTSAGSDALLARWGGEEFTVFLPRADLGQAISVFEAVRSSLRAASTANPPTFTTSWGLVAAEGSDLDDLVRRADHALYAAKEAGRDRWVIAADAPAGARPEGQDETGGEPEPAAAVPSSNGHRRA